MARIRISYKYKSFPFSEEATQHSKQLAYLQSRIFRFSVGIMMLVAAFVLYIMIYSTLPPALQGVLFIVMCVGSIIASIALLRYLERLCLARRDAALKRDLVKLAGAEGEQIFEELKRKEAEDKNVRKKAKSNRQTKTSRQTVYEEKRNIYCPHCGVRLPVGTRVCPFCGYDLSEYQSNDKTVPPEHITRSQSSGSTEQSQ